MRWRGLLLLLVFSSIVNSHHVIIAKTQEKTIDPLEAYGFEYLRKFSLGELGYFTDTAVGDNVTYAGGYLTYDKSSGGPGERVKTESNTSKTNVLMKGPYSDLTFNGGFDGFLVSFQENGSVNWGTFIGASGDDMVKAIDVDSSGNVIVVGSTDSNFIRNATIDQSLDDISEGFIIKFNNQGKQLWATYLGGSYVDYISNVLIDNKDNIIVTGLTKSADFPLLHPIDDTIEEGKYGIGEIFISKISPNGTLIWSTFLGGSGIDNDYSVTLDDNNTVIIGGLTKSDDFPFLDQENNVNHGKIDVFLVSINSNGTLRNAKILGGFLSDVIHEIEVDHDGNLVMMGYTSSSDFPVVNGSDYTLNTSPGRNVISDILVVKVSSNGSIIWSTYLGGDGTDRGKSLQIGARNEVIVMGRTSSLDYPYHIPFSMVSKINNGRKYGQGDQPSDVATTLFTSTGELGYSMYFGGEGYEYLTSSSYYNGSIVFSGYTMSGYTFPTYPKDPNDFSPFIGKMTIPGNYTPVAKPPWDPVNSEQIVVTSATKDEGSPFDLLNPIFLGAVFLLTFPQLRKVIRYLQSLRSHPDLEAQRKASRQYLDALLSETDKD